MADQVRYAFLVRQQFAKEPHIDAFYKLKIPDMSWGQIKAWNKLSGDAYANEIKQDVDSIRGMEMRYRYNSDMFQGVCLVRLEGDLTVDDLDTIIKMKFRDGELTEFLEEAKVR